ncbi:nitrilase family protein [Natronorubrum tibetense]|uniref:Nitrilase/cyanide hydratase and apolipoprotein N-acyltransferase n=1 Tax=Natronorubrum tibetense GA33 TaxID=1114856 RepID=L9VH00_9EURY|nr:nitrilase family protein [Natronorubrum tibetense]ELY36247.1 nitrilase/cyanide hydratase and apolipoprotein N-acyltransferase [Natronorubrum tibetense GA33]
MNGADEATVVAAQTVPTFGAVDRNRSRTVELVREHADADLVVLPELATTGYVFESRTELEPLAEPRDGPTAEAWAAVAAETDAWVVGGFAEVDGNSYYNSSLVVSPDGVEGGYRKVHLWNEEKRWFEPGDALPTFETPFGRLGVQICNDLWFSETTVTQARAGVDLVAVPTNWVPGPSEGERPAGWTMGVHQAVARANENRVFLACADRAGTERGTAFEGQSVIVDPDGLPLAGPAPTTGEHVLTADCDLERARTKALTPRDDALADRRPDVYDLE